jgi:hypothetical protein
MKVPTIEVLVMSLYNDILDAKKKLKKLENDPRLNIYPSQIDVYQEMSELKNFIQKNEELLSHAKKHALFCTSSLHDQFLFVYLLKQN